MDNRNRAEGARKTKEMKIFKGRLTIFKKAYSETILASWATLTKELPTLDADEIRWAIETELTKPQPRVAFLKRLNSRLWTMTKKRCMEDIEKCLKTK